MVMMMMMLLLLLLLLALPLLLHLMLFPMAHGWLIIIACFFVSGLSVT